MKNKITITDYQPHWPELYQKELVLLKTIIGNHTLDIQHIGSTSVPQLAAKPIIDIMIGVKSLDIADLYCVPAMVKAGYEYVSKYEATIPHRRYFRKSSPEGIRTHHLHMVEMNSDWWNRHILFRDHLRNHPEDRDAYGELKKELSLKLYEDKHDYTEAKTGFIEGVLKNANSISNSRRVSRKGLLFFAFYCLLLPRIEIARQWWRMANSKEL